MGLQDKEQDSAGLFLGKLWKEYTVFFRSSMTLKTLMQFQQRPSYSGNPLLRKRSRISLSVLKDLAFFLVSPCQTEESLGRISLSVLADLALFLASRCQDRDVRMIGLLF